MDAEQKKHNERVMQAMEVQAELMLSLQQATADAAEKVVKTILQAMVIVKPVLVQGLVNVKFQSWCVSEVTKIQNIGGTLEVQARYDQMLLDSGQVFPPDTDPKYKETSVKEFRALQELGIIDEEPIDEVLEELGTTKEDPDPFDPELINGETVPTNLKKLLDAQNEGEST